eukprot:3462708-Rhodomonas_salina.1
MGAFCSAHPLQESQSQSSLDQKCGLLCWISQSEGGAGFGHSVAVALPLLSFLTVCKRRNPTITSPLPLHARRSHIHFRCALEESVQKCFESRRCCCRRGSRMASDHGSWSHILSLAFSRAACALWYPSSLENSAIPKVWSFKPPLLDLGPLSSVWVKGLVRRICCCIE